MATRKLTLEISESLFDQLEGIAELTEESIETIAIRIIARRVSSLAKEVQELDEKLAQITPDQLHGEIGLEEAVAGEVY
jgi:antitoxin component of MazEF toxin-antitoxin module